MNREPTNKLTIMKLPFIQSFFGKKEKKEYFLALLLRDEKVTAVIFEELAGKVRVVGKHEELLKTSLEELSLEEWFDIFDKAISNAESTLPENIETQKTIFGVKESWVQDLKIKKEYLIRLKKASDTLGLLPIGFLVIHEAIAHLLQEEEGAPVSGILVEIGQKNITMSLLRAGRIIETKQTPIGDNVAEITDRLLHHFTSYEVLPSRMLILSDKENNEKLSQVFISHVWSKSLPFLHVPQITILPKNFDAKAVLSGAASQMGFVFATVETKEQQVQQEKQEEQEQEETFGFVKGIDVAKKEEKQHDEIKITQNEIPKKTIENQEEELLPVDKKIEEPQIKQAGTSPSFIKLFLAHIFSVLSLLAIGKKLHHTLPKKLLGGFGRKKTLFLPLIVTIIVIVAIILYVVVLKATVTLSITPKIIEQKQDISFTTKNETDIQKNSIAAESISVQEKGNSTKTATGSKEVGTNAKGTVTIYNKTSQSKTLPSGTVLTTTNDLTFTLDEGVSIASASGAADAFSSITPSTTKATVTAKNIGKESNLPSGTVFSIKSYDTTDLAAKNDTAFSGGTKKEVTVVSKNDIDAATKDITNSLAEKAKQDMAQKIDGQSKLLPTTIDTSFAQDSIDKKLNEEASTFTLSGTVTFDGLSYKENDMQQLIKNILKQNADATLIQTNTTYAVQNVKQEKNNITAVVDAKAFLLPKLDNEKIIQTITGKSFTDAKSILLQIPQVANVHITLKPNMPFFPSLLPRISRNITLSTEQQ